MVREQLKLKTIKKLRGSTKKYEAIFLRTKNEKEREIKRKFGASGMSDFTIHKDKERRNRYINRHKKDLRTNDPTRAGFLSMYVLWNKPSFKSSVADFKRRLATYNKTGKFPTKIVGSALSKYGTSFGKIPDNVKNPKLYLKIKAKIQKDVKKKKRRWGAYDSGRLVREYKDSGGKYSGKKSTKSELSRWYKEKWIDACAWPKRKSCGRTQKSKVTYCRPSVRVDSKTPKTIREISKSTIQSRCKKKSRSPHKIIR